MSERILNMTALELGQAIQAKEVGVKEATQAYLSAIEETDKDINSYITVTAEEALKTADEVQAKIDAGELTGPLAGVPVAIKDNMCTTGTLTSAASKILCNFIPPYDATAVAKAKEAGAVILGKVNMDEFAMGGSTETSYYGITKNPWDLSRVPGGSSGGSAAAVAAKLAPYALGSDTGGSIRQPCAFNNLTGIKPTYGAVSRYGLLAYASSLDQIGPIGQNIEDCAAALSMISGKDTKDSTSIIEKPFDFSQALVSGIKGKKIGVPKNYYGEGLAADVKERIYEAAKMFEALGAEVEEFEMPNVDYAVPAYYIVACAVASSNLSRFDGIKYGYRSGEAQNLLDIYFKSRSEGFGAEVKRRIMLGSFVLSSGYFDAYYKKALQVRGMIKAAFDAAFEKYDMILSPVSPTTAYEIGGQISDPIAMYMADIYTVSVNLSGIPAVALPCGKDSQGLPVGMQLIGKAFSEETLVAAAAEYQRATDFHKAVAPFAAKGGRR